MISLYCFGQILVLLQTCISQCFEPFDPKTLLVSNYENSSFPGFKLLNNADIATCMVVCFRFKLCRSVDWIQKENICHLNTKFFTKNDSSSVSTGHIFHFEKEHFPTHLAGRCLNHDCTENEICIAGKCVYASEEKNYKDCSDIVKKDPSKKGQDGVYIIYPDTRKEVFCDMTTDGGGWTVIQKRQDGDVDFYMSWLAYKHGFGNASKNYWIGNDAIHTLTKDKNQELRVDLERYNERQAYAVYSTFYIGHEVTKYILTVSGYNGTAGDSLDEHNGMQFSTYDQDNDIVFYKCAVTYHGAWWYKDCYNANLNGLYSPSPNKSGHFPIWKTWVIEALRKTMMMIRPRN